MRFTKYFNLNKNQFEVDFVNIDLRKDSPLFLDPWLIKIDKSDFAYDCKYTLDSFFSKLIEIVKMNDRSSALDLLNYLHEPSETRLGYSKKGTQGLAIGSLHASQIYHALSGSLAVRTGFLKDIEDTALLIEGIETDKVSDLVTNIIRGHLIQYTQRQCNLLGVKMYPLQSGFYWDVQNKEWTRREVSLPIYKGGGIILVPKSFVSKDLNISARDFYEKELLVFEQNKHLSAGTGLCRLLKNKELRPPHKKVIREIEPFSKTLLNKFVLEHPGSIEEYKEKKRQKDILYKKEHGFKLDNEKIVDASGETGAHREHTAFDLSKKLKNIPAGKKFAGIYHDLIIGALSFIFSGYLKDPVKEKEENEGRKRIDISMYNCATSGFFLDCVKIDIPCRRIHFECKNYNEDPKNPEIDQLVGRFDVNVTKIGFLIFRKLDDKDKFVKRCRDAVRQNRHYVIGLSDEDVLLLIDLKAQRKEDEINELLNKKLDEINNTGS